MQDDIIRRFHASLPGIRLWIDKIVDDHARQARPVTTLGFTRLSAYFPQELLERAKVVTVPHVPFPPVVRFGLPELAPVQQLSFNGITYNNTFFVQAGRASESTHFHELVHVIQWARLGVDNFLLAYGFGLIRFGYEESPLEHMAYSLQQDFDNGRPLQQLVRVIETRTDAIWAHVAPLV